MATFMSSIDLIVAGSSSPELPVLAVMQHDKKMHLPFLDRAQYTTLLQRYKRLDISIIKRTRLYVLKL